MRSSVNHRWSVFDAVKNFPSTPETLMSEIDAAIATSEYAHASALLKKSRTPQIYDARVADEAYKSGCAALAAGNIEEALRSLKTSLSSCPPDKASAIAKLRSLIASVSQQQQQLQKPS